MVKQRIQKAVLGWTDYLKITALIVFLFVLFYFFYQGMTETDTKQIIAEAIATVEVAIENEAKQNQIIQTRINEVRHETQESVKALSNDDVADAFNEELRLFRSEARLGRMDNTGNRVLFYGDRRQGYVNSSEDVQAGAGPVENRIR
jgi:hypothetical protein